METIVRRYPIQITLDDGTRVTFRLLKREDKVPLVQFFQRIPEEDRYYLKDNVTAPEVVRHWTGNMNLDYTIPILAVVEDRIIADGTLHRDWAPARRHIGEVRVTVDPEFRGRGLASKLIKELIDVGETLKLTKLVFELVKRREHGAIQAARRAGFVESAILRDRIKDTSGNLQDLIIMELSLESRIHVLELLAETLVEQQEAPFLTSHNVMS